MSDNIKSKNVFERVRNFLIDAIGKIHYQFANKRNYYACKFVGEKPNETEPHNTFILYRIKGEKEIFEIPIKKLLEDVGLLEQFHQKDTMKFGVIAMGDALFCEGKDIMKIRFDEIKQKLLSATYPAQSNFISGKNYYPCNFAGEKSNTKKGYDTIILYTIKGKRDAFEIPLKELIEYGALLEKFHPAVAVKLGAIAMGDTLFTELKESIQFDYEQIRKNMLDTMEVL